MSHKELVELAKTILYRTKRCGVVFVEFSTACNEIPDAIGFLSTESYLIECKASRNDFFGELKRKMKHYHPNFYPGNYRYYLCPDGMIKPNEVPEHWGLIYAKPEGKYKIIKEIDKRTSYKDLLGNNKLPLHPHKFDCSKTEEIKILYSALRRLQLRGVMDLIYDPITTKVKIIKE